MLYLQSYLVQFRKTTHLFWKSFTKLFLKKYLKEKWKVSLRKLYKALIEYSVDTVMDNRYL